MLVISSSVGGGLRVGRCQETAPICPAPIFEYQLIWSIESTAIISIYVVSLVIVV